MISCLVACNEHSLLLSKINQNDANTVLLLLAQNHITATKEAEKELGYSIFVPSDDFERALQIILTNGLPKQSYTNLGEVFKKDSFISSPLEEHARLIYALNQELEGMISKLDGITNVEVKISLPIGGDSLWQATEQISTASVFIKYKQGYHVEVYSNKIRQLVANAVPGLTYNNVSIFIYQQSL